MQLLEDLRFFIGLFFVVVGGLLVVQGLILPTGTSDLNINLLAGIAYVLFGILALGLAVLNQGKNRKKH